MRLTAILLLSGALTASASGTAQGITLDMKNVPVQKVFKEVSKQTGVSIIYNEAMFKEMPLVTINVTNATAEQILDKCFAGKPFTYVVEGNKIIIKKKPSTVDLQSTDISNLRNEPPPPIDITGKVTDADGNALQGASVKVKGTSLGTTTNNDGAFVLKGVDENATLEISFVGYETYTVAVNSKTTIVANLKIKPSPLDEMQVIAYGTKSKRFQTGNVATVKSEDIEKQPVNNPILALQGRVPGLTITQSTGTSGSSVTIRIQGRNNLNPSYTGSDPLIVVDGVPYPSKNLQTFNSGFSGAGILGAAGSTLSFINPADIESIDVLKDADATAIYGSRAANGAVLITTKKGKAGDTKVDLNVQTGWGKVAHKMDLLNSQQYLQMRREAIQNDGLTISGTDYDLNGLWDTTRYTDWQKELIGGTARYTRVTSTISGGNSNMNYLIGGTYNKETTVFPGDYADQKGSVHFNINSSSSNKKFSVQLTGSFLSDNNKLPGIDFTQFINLAPVAPTLNNADGTLNWAPTAFGTSSWTNPLSFNYNIFETKSTNLISNALLSYRILPGLEIKTSLGYNQLQTNQFSAPLDASVKPEERPTRFRFAEFDNSLVKTWIAEPQLSYKTNLGVRGKFDVLLGTTFQQNNSDGISNYAFGQSSDALLRNPSAGTFNGSYNINAVYKYNALFGRLNYTLKDRYLINLSARRDGSSRFGTNNLFHNFGAVGAGWIFSEENFIKQNLPFLSFGKLKASYGITGNDQIGDYQFMSLFSPIYYSLPYQNTNGLQSFGIGNPNLQWEETKKLQAGIELGLVGDRFLLSVNYYRNRTDNTLTNVKLPITTGTNDFLANFPALIENKGCEFSLTTNTLKNKDFSWNTSFNLTIPRNKLVSFPDLENSSSANDLVIGQPLSINKNYSFYEIDPANGDYLLITADGKKTTSPDYSKDRIAILDLTEKFYGGLENSFRYKNFSLDFLFQFTEQNGWDVLQIGNVPGMFYDIAGFATVANQPISVLQRWQKPGDITREPPFSSSKFINHQGDRAFKDASYLRLKNLSFSYEIPGKILTRKTLKYARVYVNAQNLFTVTKYKGLDPETQSISTLPPLRVITVGLQVTL